ncbi:phage integrase SAM-like domain-containing protein [Bacillus paralicheniformis]
MPGQTEEAEEVKVPISKRFKDKKGNVIPFVFKAITTERIDELEEENTTYKNVKGRGRVRDLDTQRFYVTHFRESESLTYIDEISTDDLYNWLEKIYVSKQTQLTRLKCLKAFLSRCFDNGWIDTKFWKTVNVKVDKYVKEGATERELSILMSVETQQ